MKGKVSIFLSAVVLSLASCDMDRLSPDSIPLDRGFETIGNIEALERGLYSRLRTAYSLEATLVPDIQADYANPVNGFSNTYANIYCWNFTQGENEVGLVWQNFYSTIGQCNYIIDGINNKITFEVMPGSQEEAVLDRVQGMAYLTRALSYSVLAERFCADYDEATATAQYSGLPLAEKYDPEVKPDRSTLAKTYERIFKDIEMAKGLLKDVKGAQNSTVLNIDCVTALEARVLLQTDQPDEALKKANELIGNTTYSLVESREALKRMWEYDESPETIFQFYASKTEAAYQFGYYFCADNFNGTESQYRMMIPDFIPTKDCVDSFDDKDWRKEVYFLNCVMNQQAADGMGYFPYIKGLSTFAKSMYIFYKYPGNPDLRTSAQWNYLNTFKVFRLAEAYLIAAEAAVKSEGDAATPLNALRERRGLAPLDDVTLADVQEERYREMLMEGTRMTDLKRWNSDLKRGEAQSGDVLREDGISFEPGIYIMTLDSDIEKKAGDYMFVWPIPESEIFAHPAYKEQQNPGWKR